MTARRRALVLALLVIVAQAAVSGEKPPVLSFKIHVDQPAYTNRPVWLKADLKFPLEVHYPYSEDPGDFGPNRIEVKREGQLLGPRPVQHWSVGRGGVLDGWIAAASSPMNRLPLHLRYSFDQAGAYSVRWTEVRHLIENGRPTEVVVAQSDWLTFELKRSTPRQRKEWLQKQLAGSPGDPGQLVGDFLPSLLAASGDPRVLPSVMERLYSNEPVVSAYTLGSLRLFHEDDVRAEAVALLHRRGASDAMATLISGNVSWFPAWGEGLVRTILPDLESRDDGRVAATLKLLGFLVHPGNFTWPPNSVLPAQADDRVLAAAPALAGRSREVLSPLAVYLGEIRGGAGRELLWQLAERPERGHEQALISLTWIGDPHDLPRLGELLVKPGGTDSYGRDRSSLPSCLIRVYGDLAVPYLKRAMAESPYIFVRTQAAEELALKGQAEAFGFFLDAVENNRFYKQELVTWLKDRFPKDLPQSADDKAVIALLDSRLRR